MQTVKKMMTERNNSVAITQVLFFSHTLSKQSRTSLVKVNFFSFVIFMNFKMAGCDLKLSNHTDNRDVIAKK